VRELVHAADPQVTETIKRTDRPYFVLEGNMCALQAARDDVNGFLYDGGIVPDPQGIITGGHDNKTARTGGHPPRRGGQRSRADRHVPADHRQQPGRRLAQAQARTLTQRRASHRPLAAEPHNMTRCAGPRRRRYKEWSAGMTAGIAFPAGLARHADGPLPEFAAGKRLGRYPGRPGPAGGG
jgi:hypothetical protein